MQRVQRRRFLQQAAVAAGAIPTFSMRSRARDGSTQAVEPATTVTHGRILSLAGGVLAVDTADGIRPLVLGTRHRPSAQVWRGQGVPAENLRVGDVVLAKGVVLQDGTFAVTALWANIVNVSGRVDRVISTTTFVMQWALFGVGLTSSRTTRVTIDDRTVFGNGSVATRPVLRPGMPIQVIGAAFDESAVHASRIFY